MLQNKKYFRRGDLAAKQAEEYKKKQEVNFGLLQSQTVNSHHCLPYVSFNVGSENLVIHQDNISKLMIFFILIASIPDHVNVTIRRN